MSTNCDNFFGQPVVVVVAFNVGYCLRFLIAKNIDVITNEDKINEISSNENDALSRFNDHHDVVKNDEYLSN